MVTYVPGISVLGSNTKENGRDSVASSRTLLPSGGYIQVNRYIIVQCAKYNKGYLIYGISQLLKYLYPFRFLDGLPVQLPGQSIFLCKKKKKEKNYSLPCTE